MPHPPFRISEACSVPPSVTIVIHDVAPSTWAACERLTLCIDRVAPHLPRTLLVVPRFHGEPPTSRFVSHLHRAVERGDELALHGYIHRDEGQTRGWADALRRRWYTAGEGEFAGLGSQDAVRRLAVGREWFAFHGWPLHGFVAPAWLMSDEAATAVAHAGFDYTCSLTHLIAFTGRSQNVVSQGAIGLRSQSVVYSTRSAWRRWVSRAWNRGVAWHEQDRPLLRIELHPGDADHRAVRRSWTRCLEQALMRRQALTLFDVTRLLRRSAGVHPMSMRPSTMAMPPVTRPVNAPATTSLG